MAQGHSISSRLKATRYILAAVAAVVVISTLCYVQSFDGSRWSAYTPWRDTPSPPTPPASPTTPAPVWDARAAQVKDAFLYAYRKYLKHATGYDELLPLSKAGINNFNAWNVTVVDSLDTMLLMGLYDQFAAALPMVQNGDYTKVDHVFFGSSAPFFETVIRYLGGLLSAYALSGEMILLNKADYLANLLEPAFNTAHGFPVFAINPATNETMGGLSSILAQIASCQLEWTYLARATGSKEHFDVGNGVIQGLENAMKSLKGGMFATHWNLGVGKPGSDTRSMGGAADSGHEYLLKQYLLTGNEDVANLQMYLLMTNEVLTRLLYLTPTRQMMYITDVGGSKYVPTHKFEHLSCFFPGLLALGAHTLPLNLSVIDPSGLSAEAQRQHRVLSQYNLRDLHLAVAEALTTSCYLMYKDQPSGLGPDIADMHPKSTPWIDALEKWHAGGNKGPMPGLSAKSTTSVPFTETEQGTTPEAPSDYAIKRGVYLLRPETIESIYIMWKVTGDPIWRERGWEIFLSIEKETKTPDGYASLMSVMQSPAPKADEQPSYFLAETLKYFYLLFSNDDPVPLDKWVFNTEAHPFPIFRWNEWEKHKFNIST
ncbi:seven-hairpin glycosidase [Daedaleopsis nitida]|nr:seven-hairpin glycosidase [Daedaleopsis nitida]